MREKEKEEEEEEEVVEEEERISLTQHTTKKTQMRGSKKLRKIFEEG